MSITMVPRRFGLSVHPTTMARWAGLGGLLVAEVLFLSLRFDTPLFLDGGPWWAYPLTHSREFWVPALLAAGTVLALGGCRSFFAPVEPTPRGVANFPGLIALHLAALAVFTIMTAKVCEGGVFGTPRAAVWVCGWYGVGVAMVATWLVALHSGGWRGAIRRRELGSVAIGAVVGVGAIAAGRLSSQFWLPMAHATLVVVRTLLGFFSSNVTGDPANCLIGVDQFTVRIAPSCSGYEGIGLVGMFLAVYLLVSRRSLRWPAAWLLIPLGTLAIWMVNAARITALVLVGAWGSPNVAVGGFHSQAGSLGILAVCLGLVVLSRQTRFFAANLAEAQPVPAAEAAEVNPTAAYLVPFLAVVAMTMVTGAFSAGFDALYPLRIVAGGAALWFFHRSYPGRLFDGSWFAAGVGVVVFGLWVALEPANLAGSRALEANYARLPALWGGVWLMFRAVGSVVVVPLAEELAFRGFLSRRLIANDFESVPMGRFTWLSFLVSSTAFGVLHGRWFAGTIAGLIYAGVYYRRGRVGDAALAHAVTNALIAITVLVTRDWTLWS